MKAGTLHAILATILVASREADADENLEKFRIEVDAAFDAASIILDYAGFGTVDDETQV